MGLNDFIQIGTHIKQLRKAKNISQKDFAELVGIPYSTYSNYENNNREPNKEQLEKIALKLDVSVMELIGLPDNTGFLNYLLSLGYEIYESPYNDKWVIHILESDSEIYITDEEMETLKRSTQENVDLRISNFLYDGKHLQ